MITETEVTQSDPISTAAVAPWGWLELRWAGGTKIFALAACQDRAIVVGSNASADLRIEQPNVSPVHFHFEVDTEGVCLVPGYRTTLLVNAAKATAIQQIHRRAIIEFAGLFVEVIVHDQPPIGADEAVPPSEPRYDRTSVANLPAESDTTRIALTESRVEQATATTDLSLNTMEMGPWFEPAAPVGKLAPAPMVTVAPMRTISVETPLAQTPAMIPSTAPSFPQSAHDRAPTGTPQGSTNGLAALETRVQFVADDAMRDEPQELDEAPPAPMPAPTPGVAVAPAKVVSLGPTKPALATSLVTAMPTRSISAEPTPAIVASVVQSNPTPAMAEPPPMRPAPRRVPIMLPRPPRSGETTEFEVMRPAPLAQAALQSPVAGVSLAPRLKGAPRQDARRVPAKPARSTRTSWLNHLGVLAQRQPLAVATGALSCALVFAFALTGLTNVFSAKVHPAKPSSPKAHVAAIASVTSRPPAAPAAPAASSIAAPMRSSEVIVAPVSGETAPATPKTAARASDPALSQAVTSLFAGRYADAAVAYHALAQRSGGDPALEVLARLLSRRADPRCSTTSNAQSLACPEVKP